MGVNRSSLNPELRNSGGLKIDRQTQKGSVVARRYRNLGYVKATITFFSGIRQTADPPATVNICANGTFFYGSAAPPASTIRGVHSLLLSNLEFNFNFATRTFTSF
jgi:hypothetical protein